MGRYNLCIHSPYKYPSNLHHFSHHHLTLSPPLPSTTTMCFHCWPFIERDLFKNFRDCMNGQWGWQHIAKKCGLFGCHVGLFGCKVDHQSLFRLRQKTYLTPIHFSPTDFALPHHLHLLLKQM
jgi:hypothetical protein